MAFHYRGTLILATGVVLAAACSSSGQGGSGSPPVDAGPGCDPHSVPGPASFVDATQAWNLGAVTGNRIISSDLDGDGYPDLVIHAISSNARTTIGKAPQLVWALMNRPRPGGGRQFVDATVDSGLFQVRGGSTTQLRSAHLAAVADVDNDGDLDVFSGTNVDPTKPSTDPGDRSEILLNDGTGHFTLAPPSAPHPAANQLWPTTGATFVDADRDGIVDLFVGFWYAAYGSSDIGVQARLYRGAGDGSFADVTAASHLATDSSGYDPGTNHRPDYGVTSCDVDGDGAPELLESAYGRQWNLLWQNDGTGVFSDVGQASGYAGDADRDYSDNQFFLCWCTVNASLDPKCAGAPKPAVQCPTPADSSWNQGTDDHPWRLNGNTFSTWCGDVDGDGVVDLYSAEIKHWWAGQSADGSELLHGTSTPGAISFTRPGNQTTGLAIPHVGASWDEGELMVAAGDLDADGREDLVVAASDYPSQFGLVFHQKPDGTFEEVGQPWGMHHACMSGLTIADFDRDGDLDVVVGSGTARDCATLWKTNEVHLYENQGSGGGWLGVRLVGDGQTSNLAGIGAQVSVHAGGATLVKQLGGGYGHMAMRNDDLLFFGLGACTSVDSIDVRWPDAASSVDTWTSVASGRFIELRRADPAVHDMTIGP